MTQQSMDFTDYAQRLREQTIACRVMHEKLGTSKALTPDQKRKAAMAFDAEAGSLRASKRIIDTRHPAYAAVVAVRSRATKYWKALTVPYPDPGVRLLRREKVEAFNVQMNTYRQALQEAAAALQEAYAELRESARRDLGELFNAGDYPQRIDLEFGLYWDFPQISPAEHLKLAAPELYEQQQQVFAARFAEAVAMTEQAFVSKFHELVSHLVDRLTGGVDGKPKTFKATTVENLRTFFDEFRDLNIGSSQELDQLVGQAQKALSGATAEELRDNQLFAQSVGQQLTAVAQQLDALMVDRPKRAITLEDDAQPAADAVESGVAA